MLMPSILGEKLFDDWMDFAVPHTRSAAYNNMNAAMRTDIRETETGFELDIDLPGFSKDELSLELKDGYLLISAAKSLNRDEQDAPSGRLVRQERYMGSMSRAFYVGESIRQEDIRARYESGVLRLLVPKESPQPALEEKKYIAIEG